MSASGSRFRRRCPGVPAEVMRPRDTWSDTAAYDAQAKKLAEMFRKNFEKFGSNIGHPRSLNRRTEGLNRDCDSASSYASMIIRDPLWNNIRVDALALQLVDTPVFQRLRYVRQLGLAYLVYPGATHTRFEHALGAYHLARLTLVAARRAR